MNDICSVFAAAGYALPLQKTKTIVYLRSQSFMRHCHNISFHIYSFAEQSLPANFYIPD